MARATVPPEVKAQALAALLAGEQPAVVAEQLGLNPATVRKWKERMDDPPVTPPVTVSRPVSRPTVEAQQRQIGAIILDLLAAKLEASAALARAATDPAWLRKQRGSELAALGQYLDSTALAIGDRLAGATRGADADGAADES